MPNRLDPIDLTDFTGGLNLRRNPLAIGENESPDMLNVDVDPRGGFYTRRGWQRWNSADVVDVSLTSWEPRNQFSHVKAGGEQEIYIVNDDKIYVADDSTEFVEIDEAVAEANIHGADFAAWGDDVYIVTGGTQSSLRRRGGTTTVLGDPSSGVIGPPAIDWSEVDAPVFNVMPRADFIEAHAGYMFVASTIEGGETFHTRLRWSHPNRPDAWRESDFIDLESQGGRITGIMAFQDHLLIFKTNNLWALYGYSDESWQLTRVSTSLGCPCTTAASRSETMAFFFSASDLGGVYAYNGTQPLYITSRLRPAFEQVYAYEKVFVSWAGRRLWVSVPWHKDEGSQDAPVTTFVFSPDVGEDGAWTMYRSSVGAIGPVVDSSDINAKRPLAAMWSTVTACVVVLDALDDAYDAVFSGAVLGTSAGEIIVTNTDAAIGVTGPAVVGQPFDCYYRTRWLHAGWPDRKKSWRRPTFICKRVDRQTELLIETFRDYDETTARRTRRLVIPAQGSAFWTEGGFDDASGKGFDWTEGGDEDPSGRGADWGLGTSGSQLVRGGSMGLARAVQMRVTPIEESKRQPWGIDGIVAKIVMRRYR